MTGAIIRGRSLVVADARTWPGVWRVAIVERKYIHHIHTDALRRGARAHAQWCAARCGRIGRYRTDVTGALIEHHGLGAGRLLTRP